MNVEENYDLNTKEGREEYFNSKIKENKLLFFGDNNDEEEDEDDEEEIDEKNKEKELKKIFQLPEKFAFIPKDIYIAMEKEAKRCFKLTGNEYGNFCMFNTACSYPILEDAFEKFPKIRQEALRSIITTVPNFHKKIFKKLLSYTFALQELKWWILDNEDPTAVLNIIHGLGEAWTAIFSNTNEQLGIDQHSRIGLQYMFMTFKQTIESTGYYEYYEDYQSFEYPDFTLSVLDPQDKVERKSRYDFIYNKFKPICGYFQNDTEYIYVRGERVSLK